MFNTQKTLRQVLAFTTLAVSATLAFANNVAGTWNMSVATAMGSGAANFVLKQDGEKISGTYSGAYGSADVTGTLKGDAITLTYTLMGSSVTYTGKVTDKKVEGTVDLGQYGNGTFTGTKD